MSRPIAHESGAALEVKIRLSPHHLKLLDSFVTPERSRSLTVAWLLERAAAVREAKEARKPYAPPTFTNEPAS